jgi:hypothetical protein
MSSESYLLLTFPPHTEQGEAEWKAATPDIPISDAHALTRWGLDPAHAVYELRLAIAERNGVLPESVEFDPAGSQERSALRTELRRTDRVTELGL